MTDMHEEPVKQQSIIFIVDRTERKVVGVYAQVCWEKLTNYFEVEPRYVNLTPECFTPDPQAMIDAVDENTIGVASILGST